MLLTGLYSRDESVILTINKTTMTDKIVNVINSILHYLFL